MPQKLRKDLWIAYACGQFKFEDKILEREFYKWALGQELPEGDQRYNWYGEGDDGE